MSLSRPQNPLRPQRTLARPAVVAGHGYWSGARVVVEFRPAPVGSGVVFVRDDLTPAARIPVTVDCQQPADRRTILSAELAASGSAPSDAVSVEMVEHVLAALFGLGVDNCEVGVTAAEMPGCDGSALAFVQAIADAGLVAQEQPIEALVVAEPVRCESGDRWIEARPPIGPNLSVEYNLDYGPDSPLGAQWAVADVTPDQFAAELAPARTFVLEAEAEAIRAQGLAGHVSPRDLLIFGADGPIDNTLRFADECARHKALDVVGDLALAGRPIVGHVVACRSGHRLNADLVRALLKAHRISSPNEQARRRSA